MSDTATKNAPDYLREARLKAGYGDRGRHRPHGRHRNMETIRTKKHHKRRRTTLRRKSGNDTTPKVAKNYKYAKTSGFAGGFGCTTTKVVVC